MTTLLAYSSGVSNGEHNLKYKDRILNVQAEEERNGICAKQLIDEYIDGKEIVITETALQKFNSFSHRFTNNRYSIHSWRTKRNRKR